MPPLEILFRPARPAGSIRLPLLCLLPLLVAGGCSPQSPPTSSTPPTAAPPQAAAPPVTTYAVTGLVVELKPDGLTARIKHEKIPGYMEAMTMPFRARERGVLLTLATNDRVEFRLNVTDTESWIDQVRVTGSAAATPPVTPPPSEPRPTTRIAREVEPLDVGDSLPNYTFTNHLGRPLPLDSFRGRALALTFIFTRCPLPDFCPRMSLHFADAARQLAARPGGPTNYHFLTLSFDVEFDTPTVLKSYASRFKGEGLPWDFATGALADIDAITEQFGLQFSREAAPFNWNHNLRTAVIDTQGRIQRIFIGNEWKPAQLVEEVVKAATATPPQP